jgi:hypothetical protein
MKFDDNKFDYDGGEHFSFLSHDDIINNLNGFDANANAELVDLIEILDEDGMANGSVHIVGVILGLQDDLLRYLVEYKH